MRRSNGLLALMAGALLMAFLPLDDTAAQGTPRTDPTRQAQYRESLRVAIDGFHDLGVKAWQEGNCELFEGRKDQVKTFTDDSFLQLAARQHEVWLSPSQRSLISHHARQRLAQLRQLDCPPKDQAVTATSGVEVSVSGGASRVELGETPVGVQIKEDGDETLIAKTDGQLTGETASFNLIVPLRILPGRNPQDVGRIRSNWAYLNWTWTEADGSSRGSVAPDGNVVGIVYPVNNPENNSTGIGLGRRGLDITTHTDFEMNDFSAGIGVPLTNGGAFPVVSVFGGVRVIEIERNDKIFDTTPAFDDLFKNTFIDLDSTLVGGQIGLAFDNRPPGQPGIIFGVKGAVTLFNQDTEARLRALVNCGPCGPDSPDFDVTLRTDFSENQLSGAFDAAGYAGFRWPNVEVQAYASVTRIDDLPFVDQRVSPLGVTQLSETDLTNVTVGGRVSIDLGSAADWWF